MLSTRGKSGTMKMLPERSCSFPPLARMGDTSLHEAKTPTRKTCLLHCYLPHCLPEYIEAQQLVDGAGSMEVSQQEMIPGGEVL